MEVEQDTTQETLKRKRNEKKMPAKKRSPKMAEFILFNKSHQRGPQPYKTTFSRDKTFCFRMRGGSMGNPEDYPFGVLEKFDAENRAPGFVGGTMVPFPGSLKLQDRPSNVAMIEEIKTLIRQGYTAKAYVHLVGFWGSKYFVMAFGRKPEEDLAYFNEFKQNQEEVDAKALNPTHEERVWNTMYDMGARNFDSGNQKEIDRLETSYGKDVWMPKMVTMSLVPSREIIPFPSKFYGGHWTFLYERRRQSMMPYVYAEDFILELKEEIPFPTSLVISRPKWYDIRDPNAKTYCETVVEELKALLDAGNTAKAYRIPGTHTPGGYILIRFDRQDEEDAKREAWRKERAESKRKRAKSSVEP